MKKLVIALSSLFVAAPAFGHEILADCVKAARAKQAGPVVKVEYLSQTPKGVPTYEIEIRDKSGTEWEFMCDAKSGTIYETETEVDSASDAKFKKNMKVSEKDAIKAATAKHQGTVKEIEYEIEEDGGSTYEIDIVAGGKEHKVEVDAATGKIIEESVEEWEIGEEPKEKRGKK
jgi:uncharacterized membrane protein YkoI